MGQAKLTSSSKTEMHTDGVVRRANAHKVLFQIGSERIDT